MPVTVTVEYVNHTETNDADNFHKFTGHGVQSVKVTCGRYSVNFSSASTYWFYKEENYYVAGCDAKYDPNPLKEVLIFSDGTQKIRLIDFRPDLLREQTLLGWWNGKKRIING